MDCLDDVGFASVGPYRKAVLGDPIRTPGELSFDLFMSDFEKGAERARFQTAKSLSKIKWSETIGIDSQALEQTFDALVGLFRAFCDDFDQIPPQEADLPLSASGRMAGRPAGRLASGPAKPPGRSTF